MSTLADQWILKMCEEYHINPNDGNREWLLKRIGQCARIKRQFMTNPPSHKRTTSMACVINQPVRILNANGLVANGVLKFNRSTKLYSIHNGQQCAVTFTRRQITRMEFRGVWLIWIR